MGGRWVRLEGRLADDDAAVHRDGWAPAWYTRASTLRFWLHWICILLRSLSYLKEPPNSQFSQPQSSKSCMQWTSFSLRAEHGVQFSEVGAH